MAHHAATARSGSRFRFIGETVAELKKVVWLTRRQAIYLTALVLVLFIISGLVLGLFDYAFTQLVNSLFLGG